MWLLCGITGIRKLIGRFCINKLYQVQLQMGQKQSQLSQNNWKEQLSDLKRPKQPQLAPTLPKQSRLNLSQIKPSEHQSQDTIQQQPIKDKYLVKLINNLQKYTELGCYGAIEQKQPSEENIMDNHQTQQTQKRRFYAAVEWNRGIKNDGNTCYMNSLLQCLHKSLLFRTKFVEQYQKIKSQLLGQSNLQLSRAFSNFLQQMQKTTSSALPIKKLVQKANPQFQGYRQNDAIEFFSSFLSILDAELDASPRQKFYEQIDHQIEGQKGSAGGQKGRVQQIYQASKKNDETRSRSICDQTFTGRYHVTYACRECQQAYVLFEKFNFHCIEIPSPYSKQTHAHNSLMQCFKNFQKKEELAHENMMSCSKCGRETIHFKTMKIYEANKILVVCLKRAGKRRKNTTDFNVPQTLPIESIIQSHAAHHYKDKEYKLYAAISHSGSLAGGHYTAVCLNGSTCQWVRYSDSFAKTEHPLDLSEAYILFYELANIGQHKQEKPAQKKSIADKKIVQDFIYQFNGECLVRSKAREQQAKKKGPAKHSDKKTISQQLKQSEALLLDIRSSSLKGYLSPQFTLTYPSSKCTQILSNYSTTSPKIDLGKYDKYVKAYQNQANYVKAYQNQASQQGPNPTQYFHPDVYNPWTN